MIIQLIKGRNDGTVMSYIGLLRTTFSRHTEWPEGGRSERQMGGMQFTLENKVPVVLAQGLEVNMGHEDKHRTPKTAIVQETDQWPWQFFCSKIA